MEKDQLPPSLEATFDPRLSLAELLQAHLAFARDTTGATAGLLARQIAAHLHVDPRTISNWLKGRHRPHDEMIRDLVDTLAKLIPIPPEVENRSLVLQKQREAIHAACRRREDVSVKPEKIAEGEEKSPLQSEGPGASQARPGKVLRFKKKNAALIGTMVALVFFGVVWAASVTDQGRIETSAAGNLPAGNSVLIGSFEEPALTPEKPSAYFPKSQVWKTWGKNGGGIQMNNSGWEAPLAPDGVQTAFMHTGDVHMSREIRIEPGTYNISIHAARRRFGQENPNPLQILVNGKEYGPPITPANTRFQKYYSGNFTVSATGIYTVEIATRSRQAAAGDTFFDKVELNSVAEEFDLAVLRNPFNKVGGKASNWGR